MREVEDALAALKVFVREVARARQAIIDRFERDEAPDLSRMINGMANIIQVTNCGIARIENAYDDEDRVALKLGLLAVPGDSKMWDYSGGGFDHKSDEGVSEAYDRANRAVAAAYRSLLKP
jgi:hypothetical protein